MWEVLLQKINRRTGMEGRKLTEEGWERLPKEVILKLRPQAQVSGWMRVGMQEGHVQAQKVAGILQI